MKNNVSKEKAFRNRIADCTLERKVITQNELENIAKRVKSGNEMYLKNADIKIDIEDILRRCKANMEETIEISFENVKDKNDTPQYEFVN